MQRDNTEGSDVSPVSDEDAMREAITVGQRGRVGAPPNPWVGCVLVAAGEIVGRGHHRTPGSPHAEIAAIADAGTQSQGATAYVTLEPCNHHGRTPPCTEALRRAGVERVVVAVIDPDPRVSGEGIRHLREHGVAVELGVGAIEASEALRPYLHQRRTGRPWCVLKAALSVDGRVAARDGTSQWITGEAARADGHRMRAESQAVVVGAGTALADRPALTARPPEGSDRQPLRVLLDSRGRVAADGPLFAAGSAPILVITTAAVDLDAARAWKSAGAEVEEVDGAAGGGVDLPAALDVLGRRGVLQALVEGGPTLQGALVTEGLVDEMIAYVGGPVLGDAGLPAFAGFTVATLDDAPRWRLTDVAAVGPDARLTWRTS